MKSVCLSSQYLWQFVLPLLLLLPFYTYTVYPNSICSFRMALTGTGLNLSVPAVDYTSYQQLHSNLHWCCVAFWSVQTTMDEGNGCFSLFDSVLIQQSDKVIIKFVDRKESHKDKLSHSYSINWWDSSLNQELTRKNIEWQRKKIEIWSSSVATCCICQKTCKDNFKVEYFVTWSV